MWLFLRNEGPQGGVPLAGLPLVAVSRASLRQPAGAGEGIAIRSCGGLWALGIHLFVILFLANRGRGAVLGRPTQADLGPTPSPSLPGLTPSDKEEQGGKPSGPGLQRGLQGSSACPELRPCCPGAGQSPGSPKQHRPGAPPGLRVPHAHSGGSRWLGPVFAPANVWQGPQGPHCTRTECRGGDRVLPPGAPVAVGADAHDGLDLGFPPGAD